MSSLPAFTIVALVAACGGTPRGASPPTPAIAPSTSDAQPDPDLESTPATPLLAIDWASTNLVTDADSEALWQRIAPTGADVLDKLEEIPVAHGRVLGAYILRTGNLQCVKPPPPSDCAPLVLDVPDPAPTATLADPCLRRVLALWALGQLDDSDVPSLLDELRTLVALPAPESELVAAAIDVVPTADHATRLDLIGRAYAAGQRDVANSKLGDLDQPHQVQAALVHHVDGALETLAAASHRLVFLAAITDDKLPAPARMAAITELVADEPVLAADVKTALVSATKSKDCMAAAAAARALVTHGEPRYAPTRPRTSSPAAMLRSLCVLASYVQLQGNDEPSPFASYVPAKGLEQVRVEFDALAETDTDGDGDPRTQRSVFLVQRADVVLPETEDMVRAFTRCTGTTCTTRDREFRFTFKPGAGGLYLARLEISERPPCPATP